MKQNIEKIIKKKIYIYIKNNKLILALFGLNVMNAILQ